MWFSNFILRHKASASRHLTHAVCARGDRGRARKVRIPETVQMAIANGHPKVCGHWRAGIICSFNHIVHCRRGVQSPRRDNRSPRCGVPQRQTGGLCGYGWTSFRVTASFSEAVEPAGQDRVTILSATNAYRSRTPPRAKRTQAVHHTTGYPSSVGSVSSCTSYSCTVLGRRFPHPHSALTKARSEWRGHHAWNRAPAPAARTRPLAAPPHEPHERSRDLA